MLYLTATTPIRLALAPVDFRRGIDGFVALCHPKLHQEPHSGTLFVFINRTRTMVRLLAYEENGYWLMTQRLSHGTYPSWPRAGAPVTPFQAKALRQLLSNGLKSTHE